MGKGASDSMGASIATPLKTGVQEEACGRSLFQPNGTFPMPLLPWSFQLKRAKCSSLRKGSSAGTAGSMLLHASGLAGSLLRENTALQPEEGSGDTGKTFRALGSHQPGHSRSRSHRGPGATRAGPVRRAEPGQGSNGQGGGGTSRRRPSARQRQHLQGLLLEHRASPAQTPGRPSTAVSSPKREAPGHPARWD